ncbi:MAG: oligosaccharide flippase family protein [Gammaproteobacteria bacterium]|nr:oligosaccharide flippase family protein [Gammaproteobacteria bacterium]
MKDTYYRKILVLFSGTGVAQLINLAGLPFLTRLYSPDYFGLFAFYSAVVAILTLFATLKYENHILLSRSQSGVTHSYNLIKILSIIAAVLVYFIPQFLTPIFVYQTDIFIWISLGVGLAGWQLANYYLLNRQNKYKVMSTSRVLAANVFLISSIGFPFIMEDYSLGLIWASIAGVFSSVIYTSLYGAYRNPNLVKSFKLLKIEPSYYRIILPSSFMDVMSSQLPLIFSKGSFELNKVGNYGLYNKCVSLPSAILGKAVADVFKQEAFQRLSNNESASNLYIDTAKKMLYIGFLPYLALQFMGIQLFSIVFGKEWSFAGEIAQVMAIRFYLGFVVSPLSSVLYFAHFKKWDFLIQTLLIVAIALTLYISYVHNDFMLMIQGLTVSYVVKYLLQFSVGYWITSVKKVRN